jgi:hypothetical protein
VGTLKVFSIVSLHFGERGGSNLLVSIATLGRWHAGPVIVEMGEM